MANPLLPSVGNTLQQLENQENWQKLYEILEEALPGRDDVQAELGKLSNNKNTYVKQLQALWESKLVICIEQNLNIFNFWATEM